MKSKIFLTNNIDFFLGTLCNKSGKFHKINFQRGMDNLKEHYFDKITNLPFTIKLADDDKIRISYRLKSFPHQESGEIYFHLDQVLCLLVLYFEDGSVQNIELHTTLMNITLNNKEFSIMPNYFKDNKMEYSDYVDEVVKNRDAEIISG